MKNLFHPRIIIVLIILLIHQPLLMAEPIRGHNINPANISFYASLALKRSSPKADRVHFCSGSLIAKNLVLTAAHCLHHLTFDQVNVMIGATDLTELRPKYNAHSWMTFKQWALQKNAHMLRRLEDDIAIIRLEHSVTDVTPANITTMKITDLYGKDATLIGWAVRQVGQGRLLMEAKVQILSAQECEQRFDLLTNLGGLTPEGMICAAANPFALLTGGDSGGPLLDENNNILGINSGMCPVSELINCSEDFADQHRYNFHVVIINDYRRFIDDMKISSHAEAYLTYHV